jgi:ribosome-binding factor A
MSNRTIRINELMQRELSDILRKKYQAETVAMTITEVRTSPDLRDARVFVSVVGSDELAEEKIRWIRNQASDIRQEISRRIVLKYLPKFEYKLDRNAGKSVSLLKLMDELGEKEHPPGTEEEPTE